MHNHFKVLVVDDDSSRSPVYEKMADGLFSLDIINDYSSFLQKASDHYDAIIIDRYLEFDEGKDRFWDVLQEVCSWAFSPKMFLISSKLDEFFDEDGYTQLFKLTVHNPVDYFFRFPNKTSLEDEANDIGRLIYNSLVRSLGLQYVNTSDPDSVTLLHLSDFHCGIEKASFGNFKTQLTTRLLNSDFNVDFIFCSGDFSHNCLPEEYDTASSFIEGVASKLFSDSDWRDRVFLTPGNHDVYLPAYHAASLKYEFPDKSTGREGEFVETGDVDSRLAMHRFAPWKDFAYGVTEKSKYISSQKLSWLDCSYANCGFNVTFLNTVSGVLPRPDCEKVKTFDDNDVLDALEAEIVDSKKDTVVNILLTHDFSPIAQEDDQSKRNIDFMHLHDLVLVGHVHSKNVIHSKNTVLTSCAKANASFERRYFDIINISKSEVDGKRFKIEVVKSHFDGGEIYYAEPEIFDV